MTERKRHAETLEDALIVQRGANEIHRRFIAMASHEFRKPLAVNDGAAPRVLARTGETPEIRTSMVRIRDSVLRMTDVIDRMLSSARLKEGRTTMEPGRVDLSPLVRAVCERQRQVSLDFEIDIAMPDEPVVITGGSRLLDQVVTNLLSNAIKYSGQSRRIEVLCERRDVAGAEAVVKVRDFGVGVPADEIDKLFTRSFRAHTASGIPGTGIGLHPTCELVRLHGGRLDIPSQVGVSSTFTVVLPGGAATVGAAPRDVARAAQVGIDCSRCGVRDASRSARSDGDRREVLEPVLRLHEAFHPRTHGARIDVVGDHQEQRLVAELLVDLLQHAGLRRGIEGGADLREKRVHRRIAVVAPIGADRRLQIALQMAHETGERILDEVAVVHAGGRA